MQERTAEQVRWVLRQVLFVVLGIVVYFGVRHLTVGQPEAALANARDVVSFEKDLGLYQEPRVQEVVVRHGWLTDVSNWVYIWGHWPVIVVVMVWLALGHRTVFLRLRNAMLASGGVGLLVFATYPVAPPRLAGLGLVDTVTEQSHAYRVLQPPAFVNQYAAMPSLHVGWDLLVGLAVASAASAAWLRWLGRMMPVLMGIAVVLTANHYIVDAVAGVALALAGLVLAVHLEHRQDRRWEERHGGDRSFRPSRGRRPVPEPRPPAEQVRRTGHLAG